jgi:membrane protease YdiL (CAAX protease family)
LTSHESPPDLGPDGAADAPPRAVLEPDVPIAPPTPPRPGTSTFTIEGRSAPALFVIGWLATIAGFGVVAIAILSGGGLRSTILFVVGTLLLSVGLIAAAGSQGIERRTRGTLPYRGPSPFLVFAAAIPVAILAVIVLSIPLVALSIPVDGPLGALLSVTVQAIVYIGLVRMLVVDTGALDWRAMGVVAVDRLAVLQMGGGALWAIPVIFVTGIVAQVLLTVFPVTPASPLPPTGTAAGFVLSFVAGAIVAPFGEEVLFRSFATTAWAKGLGARRGLVLGALFFAFAHVVTVTGATAGDAFGLLVVAFVGRIPVAFALGWLFLKRGTIWASFGLHASFNGVLLILAEVAVGSI